MGGVWGNLAHRRFGDVSEKTYTFDDQQVIVRARGSQYEVSTGDWSTSATCHMLSPTELVTSLSTTRLQSTVIPINNRIHIFHASRHYIFTQPIPIEESTAASTSADSLASPMPATVIEVRVKAGDEVKEGQICCVLESMKMEINIRAGRDGIIGDVRVEKGKTVEEGAVLVVLTSLD